MSKGKVKLVKPKCKKCGSQQVLFRKIDNIYWCRVCGNEWKRGRKGGVCGNI